MHHVALVKKNKTPSTYQHNITCQKPSKTKTQVMNWLETTGQKEIAIITKNFTTGKRVFIEIERKQVESSLTGRRGSYVISGPVTRDQREGRKQSYFRLHAVFVNCGACNYLTAVLMVKRSWLTWTTVCRDFTKLVQSLRLVLESIIIVP